MYRYTTIVKTDAPFGLSGHRDGKWYAPECIGINLYKHTSSRCFLTYDEARDYINTNCKYPENFTIIKVA